MQLTEDGRFLIRSAFPGMGQGLYAARPIISGEFILEYEGERVPTKSADQTGSRYLFVIDDDWTIDGRVPANTAGYLNHACEPNAEARIDVDLDGRKHVNIYALRSIRSGEEVTIDYGPEYFNELIKPFGCLCDSCVNQPQLEAN